MSGTSLDGLDIAYVVFKLKTNQEVEFSLRKTTTIEYTDDLTQKLSSAYKINAEEFLLFHNAYGEFLGEKVTEFIKRNNLTIDLIASHGHTIFHQPEQKFTYQIGNGASICATTKLTTISDFRSLDVALSGNGAPLVPIGDLHLFHDHKYCLNLGGFANISEKENDSIIAFDISPCNFVLNYLSQKMGKKFDENGNSAREGKINHNLLSALNALDYFKTAYPKSLGREWVEKYYKPIIDQTNISIVDKLRTVTENIVIQIAKTLDNNPSNTILITGGGTFNTFLIELLSQKTANKIIIPDNQLINYKEALIFAYLGLLRFLKRTNTLKSVTGAEKDTFGGIIHYY